MLQTHLYWGVVELTLNGAKILDWRTTGAAISLPSACTFWRLDTGPAAAALCTLGPAMISNSTLRLYGGLARVLL